MRSEATHSDPYAYVATTTPGVYRRGARYVIRYREADGKQRSKSVRTMAEAKRLLSAVTTDIDRGEYRPDKKVRFSDYARKWLVEYTGRTRSGVRPETVEEYTRDLERAIQYYGRKRIAEIGTPEYKAFARHVWESRTPYLQQSTVARILAPLRACLATAAEDGIIGQNPTTGVRVVVPDDRGNDGKARASAQRVKPLAPDQLARLIEETPSGPYRLQVRLMAQTGLRISEALALRWCDVDGEKGRIYVRQRVRRGKVGQPKSSSGIREIPISDLIVRDLRLHRLASMHSLDDDLVFGTRRGTPVHAPNAYRWFKKAAHAADVEWAGFHTLRHTAASRWLQDGVNIAKVSVLLGHSDPSFTLRRYIHVMPTDLPSGEALAAAVGIQ
mgnify:FL=1